MQVESFYDWTRRLINDLMFRVSRLENGAYDAAQKRFIAQDNFIQHQRVALWPDACSYGEEIRQSQSQCPISSNSPFSSPEVREAQEVNEYFSQEEWIPDKYLFGIIGG